MAKRNEVDIINGPIDKTLRQFAMPLAISFLIQNLYTWIDLYFVSRLGTEAIAAIKVCEQLIFMMFAVVSGFAIGSGIIVARRIGEGNHADADYVASQSSFFMLLISLVITLFFVFFTDFIVSLMNLETEVSTLVVEYMRTVAFGVPATFLIFHINAIIRATGNSVFPMMILIIANLLNALLDPFLIFGIGPFPRLEMQGAAISTGVAQNIGLLIAVTGIFKKKIALNFYFKKIKLDYSLFGKIFKIGMPATLQIVSVSINRMLMLTLANTFGVMVLTTYMFGVGVDLFVFMSIFAVGAAMEIITGQNLGANKVDRIFAYHRSAIKQLSVLSGFLIVLVFVFGKQFVGIFVDDLSLINEIEIYLRIAVFAYIPFAVGIVSIRVISGAGDYFRSFRIVAFIFFGIQLPFAYILSKHTGMGFYGIWWAIFISHIVFAILGLIALYRKKWLKVKV
jgi:putative MATE family efflux protein